MATATTQNKQNSTETKVEHTDSAHAFPGRCALWMQFDFYMFGGGREIVLSVHYETKEEGANWLPTNAYGGGLYN